MLRHLQSALELLDPDPLPVGGTSPAPPPPRHLALTAALLEALRRLQPAARGDSFAPRFLLALLRSRLPPGLLEPGEEHDAAEAAGSLLDLVSTELQAGFACSGARRRLLGHSSLAAVLADSTCLSSDGSGSSGGGSSSVGRGDSASIPPQCGTQTRECNCAAVREPSNPADASSVLSHPICSSGSSDGEGGSSCDEAAGEAPRPAGASSHGAAGPHPASVPPASRAAAAGAAATAPPAGAAAAAASPAAAAAPQEPVLHAWRRRVSLPLQGSTAGELQCLRCGHRSCLQLAPFWVLPLGITAAAGRTLLGNVPAAPGAALEGCLAAFFGYEALQGVHCTRCSLRASLEAAGSAAPPAGGNAGSAGSSGDGSHGSEGSGCSSSCNAAQAHQLRQVQQLLAHRSALLLESEAYRGMLERAGWLAWAGSWGAGDLGGWQARSATTAAATLACSIRVYWSSSPRLVPTSSPPPMPLPAWPRCRPGLGASAQPGSAAHRGGGAAAHAVPAAAARVLV